MIEENGVKSQLIEGRNAVMEAFRSGKPIDKVYVLDGCQDGPIRSIVREAKKHDTILNFVTKERLAQISETGKHQGVIAMAAAYEYAQVEDMLELAKEKGCEEEFNLYRIIEKLVPTVISEFHGSEKKICSNVDFYSGFVYTMLNIPRELYTPLFAVARIAGWSAHRIEEIVAGGRIYRPAYKNVGGERPYVPMEERHDNA